MVQWLRLGSPDAGDPGLMPGQGTRYHTAQLRVGSLVVQWLRLGSPNAGDPGLMPGQGTRYHSATKSWQATIKDSVCGN